MYFAFQYDPSRHDLHVKEAWEQGYTGRGIVVSILDDGIEKNHPDLQGNYVSGWMVSILGTSKTAAGEMGNVTLFLLAYLALN